MDGFYLFSQAQEERLTKDLRDIMREADINILEDLDIEEKAEQEEALKSIAGAAGNGNREETMTADEEVDVESVWSPEMLIQVGGGQRKLNHLSSIPSNHYNLICSSKGNILPRT